MDTFDLKHKKRSISDLVRYIKNTSSNAEGIGTPNFSLLLGAGASVTSGIRSGNQLVKSWKQEIYDEEHQIDETEESFYERVKSTWFDENNAYSSLFEHRYDLQRQRRMFVENQVAGKSPSIGYAYLVSLIDKNFFNTVFTTNFDDLLNESFYRFSSSRPIVCAHDSSISGVTITSKRPKIIKLHGDYLFDNIKTTLRETESLEQNMRQKFQEFAKDFGLIVIGYSGQDRSIMDILAYLLQHDEYLKNGVYWCLREGEIEKIGGELKKLLWRERVYYIEIDGFDEFMAELNYKLTNGSLPINDDLMTRHHQEQMIKELTESTLEGGCSSKYLLDDCKRLKQGYAESKMKDVLQFAKENSFGKSVKKSQEHPTLKSTLATLSNDERKQIADLQEDLYILRKREQVLSRLNSMNILQLFDNQYKLELLEMFVDSYLEMDDPKILEFYDELIRLNPLEQKYYIIAADRSLNFVQKYRYYKRAIESFPNDYFVYNQCADLLLEHYEDCITIQEDNDDIKFLNSIIENSLKLNSSITNKAHKFLLRYFKLIYINNTEVLHRKTMERLDLLNELNKYHPTTLYATKLLKTSDYNEALIRKSIEYYRKADSPYLLEECYSVLLDYVLEKKGFEQIIPIYNEYEQLYNPSEDYIWRKAQRLRKYEYFDDALKLFNKLDRSSRLSSMKMDVLFNLNRTEEAESYYHSLPHDVEVEFEYLQIKENYKDALALFEKEIYCSDYEMTAQLIEYSYLLLHVGDYKRVENLLKKYYEHPQTASAPIIINYLYARQKLGYTKASDKVKEKIIENKFCDYDPLEKAAAYAVMGNEPEMLRQLKKAIEKSPLEKYNVRRWPIMKSYLNDEQFKKLIMSTPHVL